MLPGSPETKNLKNSLIPIGESCTIREAFPPEPDGKSGNGEVATGRFTSDQNWFKCVLLSTMYSESCLYSS